MKEALNLALEALEKVIDETPTTHVRAGKAMVGNKEHVALWFDDCSDPIQQAIYINATKPEKLKQFMTTLRKAIEEAEKQEPVGKFAKFTDGIWREVTEGSAGVPLYTTPPQRTWVGLTQEKTK